MVAKAFFSTSGWRREAWVWRERGDEGRCKQVSVTGHGNRDTVCSTIVPFQMNADLKDLTATVQHLLDLTSPPDDSEDASYYSEDEEDEYDPRGTEPDDDEEGDEEEEEGEGEEEGDNKLVEDAEEEEGDDVSEDDDTDVVEVPNPATTQPDQTAPTAASNQPNQAQVEPVPSSSSSAPGSESDSDSDSEADSIWEHHRELRLT